MCRRAREETITPVRASAGSLTSTNTVRGTLVRFTFRFHHGHHRNALPRTSRFQGKLRIVRQALDAIITVIPQTNVGQKVVGIPTLNTPGFCIDYELRYL
jgi:hypothetical protein